MSSEDDQLADYLAAVRQFPRLTHTEERDLLKRAREGDNSARKRVIEGHLELTAVLALRPTGCATSTPSRKPTSC